MIAHLKDAAAKGVSGLFPGYFAMTMATGIVSISAQLLGMASLARTLFVINLVAYGVLWLMTLGRIIFFFPRLAADLSSHAKGPGFFTLVAGTCVLGSQFVIVSENISAATTLWFLGIGLWLVLIYSFLTAVTISENKPDLEKGFNAVWLVLVVATQSVSVLGTLISPRYPDWQEAILFFTLSMFLIGCMLYMIIISLIFYRWTFFKLTPEMLTPPYWINMGAVAITTLAGSGLIMAAPRMQLLQDILPFLKGFSLFFWSTGTWWIPMLLILGVWRHFVKRIRLSYDPLYWSMVFPLGMYTAATMQLSKAIGLESLELVPRYFFYVAILAWSLTFAGLLFKLMSGIMLATKAGTTASSE